MANNSSPQSHHVMECYAGIVEPARILGSNLRHIIDDQIKDYEMRGACSTHERGQINTVESEN